MGCLARPGDSREEDNNVSAPWHLHDMPKVELEATREAREATLELAGAEVIKW